MPVHATRILLVRHGTTEANRDGGVRMMGWADLPLDAEGEREAERLAERLAREPPPAAIYASPLQRAVATAERLAARWGGLAVHLERDLREISVGEFEGLPVEVVQARDPQGWARNLRQDDPDFRWPGGESYREHRARVVAAVKRLVARHPGERLVLVTHTGVVSQLVGWMNGTSPARWESCRPANASVTEIALGAGRPRLVRFSAAAKPDAPSREGDTHG